MKKILPCRFKQSFGPFNMFTVHKCSETGLFGHLLTLLFQSKISKRNNLWGWSFCAKYSKFYVDIGNVEKNQKILFNLEIIALELDALNIHFYWGRVLVIVCQYVNKQFQDFRYTTKSEFFEVISFQSNQKLSQKYWHADLSSVSIPWTCWPSMSVLTRSFLGM